MPSQTRSLAFAAMAMTMAACQAHAQYSATYTPSPSGLPQTTEQGQTGTNDCGTGSSQKSQCQNFYLNSLEDFCIWAPPNGGEVAEFEQNEVAWCTQSGRGTRVIPEGTIQGAHFVKTPSYVQITGYGDFTKVGITAGDQGGELDPHGYNGLGNPIGGLMFHNGQQMHEWMSFQDANSFCTRACFDGDRATSLCRHTYDELGCDFNFSQADMGPGFDSCQGNDAQDIMYGYPGLSTFQQADTTNGVQVPSPHPAPASSDCSYVSTITGGTASYIVYAQSTSSSSSSSTSSSSSSSSSTSTTSSMATSTSVMSSTMQTTSFASIVTPTQISTGTKTNGAVVTMGMLGGYGVVQAVGAMAVAVAFWL